ncbi:hypothetical protein LCGC14_0337570 [marine sediment metagenome]|uniref:Uncharacterized protein n=1 Tax=marine sediment metagenome TaxID=412755 RepID=A0A0F9TEU5_9ZZZZ
MKTPNLHQRDHEDSTDPLSEEARLEFLMDAGPDMECVSIEAGKELFQLTDFQEPITIDDLTLNEE